MDTDFDELAPARNGRPPTIPPLPPDASQEDMVNQLNLLTDAVNAQVATTLTHSIELGGIRSALQAHGSRIETTLQEAIKSIELAIGTARARPTDPAPPPGDKS